MNTITEEAEEVRKAPGQRRTTRRRFLAAAAAGLAAVPAGRYTFDPRVSRRTFRFRNLPEAWDGAQILHLTDLHRGPLIPAAYLAGALETARALPHDMLLLTGDYVSHRAGYIHDVVKLLQGWRPPLGVWSVLGNHDHDTGAAAVTAALQAAGIPVLNNTATSVRRGGESVWIAGTDDPATSRHDLERALSSIPDGAFRILLAHSPDVAWGFRQGAVDLALCGHTHGGQVCLPGGQAIIAGTSLGVDYAHGTFLWRGATLFVNRGLGVVTLPVRAFCPPEIAHITLRRGDPAQPGP